MTIAQVIDHVDRLKPNPFSTSQKIEWISQLDRTVWEEVIKTHDRPPAFASVETFDGYSEEDLDEEPLIGQPYGDDCYYYWLQAMIDKTNGEIERYNQNITMFGTVYNQFTGMYNKRYMPLQPAPRFLF